MTQVSQRHRPLESVAVALDNFLCQSPLQLQQNGGLFSVPGRTVKSVFRAHCSFGSRRISHPPPPTRHLPGLLHVPGNLFGSLEMSPPPASFIFYEQQILSPPPLLLGTQRRILTLTQEKLMGIYLFF